MFIPLIPPPIYDLRHRRVFFTALCCNFSVRVGRVERGWVIKEEAIGALSSIDDEVVEFKVLDVGLVNGIIGVGRKQGTR